MKIGKAFRNWWVRGICIYLVVIIIGTLVMLWTTRLQVITEEAVVSISMGGQVKEYVPPTFRVGGLPIQSVSCNRDGYILQVIFSRGDPLTITETDIADWGSVGTVEKQMNNIIADFLGESGYGSVHVEALNPLKFTPRFSPYPIEGEWWK